MRQPTVCFRKQTQSYYVAFGKKQTPLGKDKAEAYKEYHRLMADRQPPSPTMTVVALLGKFQANLKQTAKAVRTVEWYGRHITSLRKWLEDRHNGRLTVADLTGQHVDDWIQERYPKSGNNDKNGAIRAISRVCNWARKRKMIPANPIAEIERPKQTPRDPKKAYLKPESWSKIVAAISPGPFLDIVRFLKLTGCRPHEACIAEVRHFDRVNHCLVFSAEESKGKETERVIQLSGEAFEIVSRLALKCGDGHIFRTTRNRPWSSTSLNSRFDDIEESTGIKFFPYQLRHTFVTDALSAGMDPVTLANIVGHADLKMIHRVYQHLNLKGKHLRDALDRLNIVA